jgi:dienelactone hydrolase
MRIVKPAHAVFPDQTAKSLKSSVNVSVYEHRRPTLNRMPVFTQGISGLFRYPLMRGAKKNHSLGLIGFTVALLSAGCSQEYTVTGKALPAGPASGSSAATSASASTSTPGSGNPTTVPPATNAATRQRIQFTGSKSDQVLGYLWVPANRGQKKLPGLIFMYGITGNKDDGGVAEAARILAAANFVVMTMDWPGTGERLPAISKADRVTNKDRVMQWTVADYGAALTWLASRPEVRSDRLGYAGASMGAMTGIVFTKGDPRVKAMVAMVPLPNLLWGSSAPESAIRGIAPRPLLCIMADEDPLGKSVCDNAGANAEKKNFPGKHELTNSRLQAANAARDFFIRHLGN